MILLTDEEIRQLSNSYSIPHPSYPAGHYIAKAQLKKVNDWLNESCNHLDAVNWKYRFSCPVCRLALEDEVKE